MAASAKTRLLIKMCGFKVLSFQTWRSLLLWTGADPYAHENSRAVRGSSDARGHDLRRAAPQPLQDPLPRSSRCGTRPFESIGAARPASLRRSPRFPSLVAYYAATRQLACAVRRPLRLQTANHVRERSSTWALAPPAS